MTQAVGYFGEVFSRNLGDEAVYTALRLSAMANMQLFPITPAYNFNHLPQKKMLKQLSSIMIGGGTQFTPMNALKLKTLTQYNDQVWSFGTGVGSCGFCEPQPADLTELIPSLKQINPLTVRGPYSQGALLKLGINSEVIGDPALCYARQRHTGNKKKILVNLLSPIDPTEKKAYAYFAINLACCLTSLQKKGWEISFVALGPGDYQYLKEFRSKFHFTDSQINQITVYTEDFLDLLLADFSLLISMRLHGAILAACVGIPFLLCNYRQKCADFALSVNHGDLLIASTSTTSDLFTSIEFSLHNKEKISRSLNEQAHNFRQNNWPF